MTAHHGRTGLGIERVHEHVHIRREGAIIEKLCPITADGVVRDGEEPVEADVQVSKSTPVHGLDVILHGRKNGLLGVEDEVKHMDTIVAVSAFVKLAKYRDGRVVGVATPLASDSASNTFGSEATISTPSSS